MIRMCACATLIAVAGGCSTDSGARVVGRATDSQRAMLFDQVKQLEGTWEMPGEDGKPATIVFQTSSAGSVVRETMFPGSPHEMTNVYHMDGSSLVMTHYCAGGNQPRMRAVGGKPGEVDLRFDSVSNLSSAETPYMGEMKLTMKDKDHVMETWRHFKDGKAEGEPVEFVLTRKK